MNIQKRRPKTSLPGTPFLITVTCKLLLHEILHLNDIRRRNVCSRRRSAESYPPFCP